MLEAPVPSCVLRRLAPALPLRLLYTAVWPPTQIAGLTDYRPLAQSRPLRYLHFYGVRFNVDGPWPRMLTSLLLMGRRRARARAMVAALRYRRPAARLAEEARSRAAR
jgi:hypothetical protein